ncbi:MAG TPA: GreA/GreB family elongation factor [Xanthobacteraceae bacterium]|nr:GreA/GreB family elongation factor [Xanthobacteraceae bacterium]
MAPKSTDILVTSVDRSRLLELIDRAAAVGTTEPLASVDLLTRSLEEARIVRPAEMPRNVATLNSRVVYRANGPDGVPEISTVTLVNPHEANPQLGRASVLSPVGSALMGLAEGQSIDWPDETGATTHYTLMRVVFQPEAAGRFDL